MVSSPAVARSATAQSCCLAITSDSAPGQKAAASWRPRRVSRPSSAAASTSRTCTISGLNCGRRLASKIAATARPLVASAPKPYTVSVGNATSLPSRSALAAASIASLLALTTAIAVDPAVAPFPSGALRPNLPLTSRVETATRARGCHDLSGSSRRHHARAQDRGGPRRPDRRRACSTASTRTPSAPSSRRPASSPPRCWSR